jgi:uncharacterized DUF497 family protein
MEISFDAQKDWLNQVKHGISLADAVYFEWDSALETIDARRNYGECRMIAISYLGGRLHVIVYVDRGDVRRIISLRKANLREVNLYAKT